MYITSPEKMQVTTKPGIAVLYLTDVFGIQLLENKLLVYVQSVWSYYTS